MSWQRWLRLVSIPTLAFAWVVLQYVQLDGERAVSWRVGERSPFIQSPLPADRVQREGDALRLTGDPVYVHVTPPPGRWKSMTVHVDLEAKDQAVIELGVTADPRTGSMEMRPLAHAMVEALSSEDWDLQRVGEMLTATRHGATPTRATTRVYRAPSPLAPEQRWSVGKERTFPVELRGGHEWRTYGQKGDVLRWSTVVTDRNLVDGPDDLALIVQTETGEEIARSALTDTTSDTPRPLGLEVELPQTGAYAILLSSTSDIVWSDITTNATHLVAKNHVRFTGPRTTDIWTNAALIGMEHPAAKYPMGLGEGTHRLTDIVPESSVVGEGWFALTGEDLWSPTLTPLTTSTAIQYVDRIIARQPSFTQTFDFSSLRREPNGSFRLTLSLPGVRALPGEQQPVLHELTITYEKDHHP